MKLKEYNYWNLVLAESQHLIGWSIAKLKRDINFFEDLTDEELLELKQVIKDVKQALNKTFKPDWFNVMQCGNMQPKLHVHLVPRYKEKRNFEGRDFVDNNFGGLVENKWVPEDNAFLEKLGCYISSYLRKT
ncbi:MAG: HIT family protein [Candidatus Nanoarchaeia archaeon]